MFEKTIKYTDFNGEEREDVFHFHFMESELAEMNLTASGGLQNYVEAIINTHDNKKLIELFKEIILKSYGEKAPDGVHFIKTDPETGRPLYEKFRESPAFSALFMELATDDIAGAEFVNHVIPADAGKKLQDASNVASIPSATPAV